MRVLIHKLKRNLKIANFVVLSKYNLEKEMKILTILLLDAFQSYCLLCYNTIHGFDDIANKCCLDLNTYTMRVLNLSTVEKSFCCKEKWQQGINFIKTAYFSSDDEVCFLLFPSKMIISYQQV